MNIKQSIEDFFLRKHVKSLVECFYLLHGVTLKDVERMTNKELLDVLKELLELQHKKVAELELRNSAMHKVILRIEDENKNLQKTNDDLYDRNELLVKQIYERNDFMKSYEKENESVI